MERIFTHRFMLMNRILKPASLLKTLSFGTVANLLTHILNTVYSDTIPEYFS